MQTKKVWRAISSRIPSQLTAVSISLFLLLAVASTAFAAVPCVAVGPSSTGSGSGADWNNVKGISSVSWAYGTRYYLKDGSSYPNLRIGTPSGTGSATNVVELRKAQSYDYGRSSDGCSTDVSAGWNASTMGSSQAVFPWTSAGRFFNLGTSGYITLNGNSSVTDLIGCGGVYANPPSAMTGQPPTPSNCGIKVTAATCTSTANDGCDSGMGEMYGGGPDVTVENVDLEGSGQNPNGNNNQEAYFWWATPTTNMLVKYSFMHNFATTCITNASGGWNNGNVHHNYVWGTFDGSVNHGECFQDQAGSDSGTAIHDNIFRDTNDNGILVFVTAGGAGTHANFGFYDNINFCSSGNSCRHNDGFVGCYNSEVCNGFVIVQNVEIGFSSNCGVVYSNSSATPTIIENNIIYNCSGAFSIPKGATEGYNTFLNSGSGGGGSGDISVSTGAPNPFVNWQSGNFALASQSTDWNTRANLSSIGSQYQLDFLGNSFSTDRGAFQFGNLPSPPTNVAAGAVPSS